MKGGTVLIVEDDAALQVGLKDNFEGAGYTVHTASNGEKALNAILDLKPAGFHLVTLHIISHV